MGRTKPPKQADLKPVDWAALTPHYQAGIRSLKSMGDQFGVTPAAILKHMRKRGIERDLKARIVAAAQVKVNAAALATASMVNAAGKRFALDAVKVSEPAVVDANANVLAAVQIGHRSDIARTRKLVVRLLAELESVCDSPELYAMVHDALSDPDEPAIEALRNMAGLVASLPQRTKVLKDLCDALARAIGMEREAFGLDTASGTDGRPVVVIRDFTGRGDRDAPARPPEVDT